MKRQRAYYIRRAWGKEPGALVGMIIELHEDCERATLHKEYGYLRVPGFVFRALRPLTVRTLRTVKHF